MADIKLDAEISIDAKEYLSQIERLSNSTEALGKKIGLTDQEIKSLQKTLGRTSAAVSDTARQTNTAAAAQTKYNKALTDGEGSLARARYALYDVATTYGVISAATLGAVTATTNFAVQFESAFTGVQRTLERGVSPAGVQQLRDDLLQLSTEIPRSFQDITEIAQLGNQLGIAAGDVTEFTKTIAMFSTVSGISVEAAATAFGRLNNLLGVGVDQFDNLGSAMAYSAVTTAATEAQIIAVTRELAAVTRSAGFSADEVIGLSAALASLGVPPERSRSTILQFYEALNTAVASGGQQLQNFATITGTTATELEQLVRTGQGEDIFRRFLGTASTADTVELTQALQELGLAGLRTSPTIRALAQNFDFYTSTVDGSKAAFAENAELQRQYALILDDVASQITLLGNSFAQFLAVAGQPFLEFLGSALPPLIDLVNGLTDFARTDAGQTILTIAGALALTIGVITAYRAAVSLATASTFALVTAQRELALTGAVGGIRGLISAMFGLTAAAGSATVATRILTVAIKLLKVATVVGAVTLLIDLFADLRGGVNTILGGLFTLADANQAVSESFYGVVISVYELLNALPGLSGAFAGTISFLNGKVAESRAGYEALKSTVLGWASTLPGANDGVSDLSDALSGTAWGDYSDGAYDTAGALDGVGGAAGGAAAQVRTLVDYASDLATVLSRASDIRFKSQLSVDSVADSWDDLNSRIQDARIKLMQLTAQRDIKEFFLTVAEAYGDNLRAGVLRGDIADLNSQIAETQADASTELKGNSKAARQNRKTITDLLSGYQDYITSLAESGASQSELNKAVAKSRADFIAQAQALGFSNAQLKPYIKTFDDMRIAIARVPRNITVTANVNPAIQALNEFVAQAKKSGGSAGSGFAKSFKNALSGLGAPLTKTQWMRQFAPGISASASASAWNDYIAKANARYQQYLGGWASGGYTGAGGKYEPAGIVHRGEYVIPKQHVNQRTGLPNANALGKIMAGAPSSSGGGYANGGLVSGKGPIMVELSPRDRRMLAREVVNYVQIGSEQVSRAAGNGATSLSRRGSA